MHALVSVRAHLGAARDALEVALASASEARNVVDHLGASWGSEHYAQASMIAERVRQDVHAIGRRTFDDTLTTARSITDLMDVLRDLQSARWS